MGFLSQLRIGARLWLSHGLLIVLLVVIGAYGAKTAGHLAKDMAHTANVGLVKVSLAQQLEAQVNITARAARDLLLLDAANQIKRQNAAIDAAGQETGKALEAMAQVVEDDADKAALAELKARSEKFSLRSRSFAAFRRMAPPRTPASR